jgi:hypothetical protein
LLHAVSAACEQSRQACLSHLRHGRPRLAWRAARRCYALDGSAETLRLMAVSALLAGDLATAAALGQQA